MSLVRFAAPAKVSGVLLGIGLFGLFWSKVHPQAENRQHILQQAKMLGIALLKYEDHHNHRLPPVANWEAELRPYLADKNFSFVLPGSTAGKPHRWILERTVAGHWSGDLRQPEWERVVFFEAQASQSSPTGTLDLVLKDGNEEGFVVVYADRLAEYIPASQRSTFLLKNERPLATP